jgi:hypothetical protein
MKPLKFHDSYIGLRIAGLPVGKQIVRISLFDLNGSNVGLFTDEAIHGNECKFSFPIVCSNKALIYKIVLDDNSLISGKMVRLKH